MKLPNFLASQEVRENIANADWVDSFFGILLIYLSKISGYLIGLAVMYMVFFIMSVPDMGTDYPKIYDSLKVFAGAVLNMGPEAIFPGVIVISVILFLKRQHVTACLYMLSGIFFLVLTIIVLSTFTNGEVTKNFIGTVTVWRLIASIFYTTISEYSAHFLREEKKKVKLKKQEETQTEIKFNEDSVKNLIQSELNLIVGGIQQEIENRLLTVVTDVKTEVYARLLTPQDIEKAVESAIDAMIAARMPTLPDTRVQEERDTDKQHTVKPRLSLVEGHNSGTTDKQEKKTKREEVKALLVQGLQTNEIIEHFNRKGSNVSAALISIVRSEIKNIQLGEVVNFSAD